MPNVCPICNSPLRQYGKDFYVCEVCETYFDKNENIVLTEQEWLQTATTEQLAEWIARRVNESVETALHDDYLHDGKIDWNDYMVRSDDIAEWLKQPHHSE